MPHPYVNTAIKAARKAGDIIMRAFQRLDLIQISQKGQNDFVSNVDKAAEAAIIQTLQNAYPDHGILAEESGQYAEGEYQWIIDPLDGTTNFIHGIPHFAISIALQYQNRIEHAVIYDPVRNDLFTATRGSGAQKNQNKIRVSKTTKLQDAILATGFPYKLPEQHDAYFTALKAIFKDCCAMRRAGAAALDLAYVAAGQFDGFWELGLSIWDIAAGSLLIKEAGGLISDIQGKEHYLQTGNVVTGNPKIFKQLLAKVQPIFTK
jgi:myo-inositol-1(or 4)-monophosphatase